MVIVKKGVIVEKGDLKFSYSGLYFRKSWLCGQRGCAKSLTLKQISKFKAEALHSLWLWLGYNFSIMFQWTANEVYFCLRWK